MVSSPELSTPVSSAPDNAQEASTRNRILYLSSLGFALMFAAWTMFGVLGIPIQKELGISDIQLAWISAIAILNGALWRLPLGVLADRWGGRVVFIANLLCAAAASFFVTRAHSYEMLLLCAFLVGIAGNSFTVGSAWNAAWFPKERQGFAMGFFGAGNVGASVTKLIGPWLIGLAPAISLASGLVPGGWRFVPFLYSVLLIVLAIIIWFATPRVDRVPGAHRTFGAMLTPLKQLRVWRFSLYYTVVFGAYVALSVSLPKYYVSVYGLELKTAALITAPFIFASSLLRPFGGVLSDRFGPRRVTYFVFAVGALCALILFLPLNIYAFTSVVFIMGVTQGLGKASTIKYIPEYYPQDVGAVVGLVGALAALGGFVLPLLFAYLKAWTGVPQSMFWSLFALSFISLVWLHLVVMQMKRDHI